MDIHKGFIECPWNHEELDKFFGIEKLNTRMETYSLMGDVNEYKFAKSVMEFVA